MIFTQQYHKVPIKEILAYSRFLFLILTFAMLGYSAARYVETLFPLNFRDVQYNPDYVLIGDKSMPFQDFEISSRKNVFGTLPPPPKINENNAASSPPLASNELLKNLELRGTVVWSKTKFAMIHSFSTQKSLAFKVGDPLFDTSAILHDVAKQYVKIKVGDEIAKLEFAERTKKNPGRRSAPRPAPTKKLAKIPARSNAQSVQTPSEPTDSNATEFNFQRNEIDEMLNNRFGELLSEARVVPAMEEGKITGYTINKIKKKSFYERLGLKNGDIIKKVNGQTIESPEKAFALFRLFRAESMIFLEINRKTVPMTFTYFIQ